LEKARNLPDELLAYQQTLLMTLFPPRIRKMDEYPPDGAFRLESLQRESRVFCKDARARPKTSRTKARVHDASPLAAHFETQQGEPRFALGAVDEKPTSSRADLELQPLTRNERAQVDPISLGEAGRVFVRAHHGRR